MSKRAEEAAFKAEPGMSYSERVYHNSFLDGYEQAEKDLGWHSVKESLPPIDEEVIVLSDNMHGLTVKNANRISFGHIVNPNGYNGKDILTGKVTHYDAVSYNGWNVPGVTHWMYLPKLEEE